MTKQYLLQQQADYAQKLANTRKGNVTLDEETRDTLQQDYGKELARIEEALKAFAD